MPISSGMKQDTAATELRRRRFSARGQHYHRNSQSSWTSITRSVFYEVQFLVSAAQSSERCPGSSRSYLIRGSSPAAATRSGQAHDYWTRIARLPIIPMGRPTMTVGRDRRHQGGTLYSGNLYLDRYLGKLSANLSPPTD